MSNHIPLPNTLSLKSTPKNPKYYFIINPKDKRYTHSLKKNYNQTNSVQEQKINTTQIHVSHQSQQKIKQRASRFKFIEKYKVFSNQSQLQKKKSKIFEKIRRLSEQNINKEKFKTEDTYHLKSNNKQYRNKNNSSLIKRILQIKFQQKIKNRDVNSRQNNGKKIIKKNLNKHDQQQNANPGKLFQFVKPIQQSSNPKRIINTSRRKNTNPIISLPTSRNVSQQKNKIDIKVASKINKKRQLEQYLNFICAPQNHTYPNNYFSQNQQFFPFSISNIKQQSMNVRTAYLIQNIFMRIYENLVAKKYTNSNTKQYCLYYLSLTQKFELQRIISGYFIQLCIKRDEVSPGKNNLCHNLFVYQRLSLYQVFIIMTYGEQQIQKNLNGISKYNKLIQSLKKIIYDCQTSFNYLVQLILQQININSKQETLNTPNKKSISDAFKTLKIICQVQKNIVNIQSQFKLLYTIIQIRQKGPIKQFYQIQKSLYTILSRYSGSTKFQSKLFSLERKLNWKYLQIPPIPFLPPNQQNNKHYTLVLDLDQTLISYKPEPNQILTFRPYLKIFLQTLSPYFQIVVFTASTKAYADNIINKIDPSRKFITYRLYREHLRVQNSRLLKDIKKLGRQLEKVIIIDNLVQNFRNCPQNGIHIETYMGNKDKEQTINDEGIDNDDYLKQLMPYLKQIGESKGRIDVRRYLKKFKLGKLNINNQNSLVYDKT